MFITRRLTWSSAHISPDKNTLAPHNGLNQGTIVPCKQSQQFLLFLYFPVSCLAKNSRLCQLLALCLKCCCPETWTGFQTVKKEVNEMSKEDNSAGS